MSAPTIKVSMLIFSDMRQNRLPWQGPLSNRQNKVGLIMPTHMFIYPENLVKISPVLSEIIGLQGDR